MAKRDESVLDSRADASATPPRCATSSPSDSAPQPPSADSRSINVSGSWRGKAVAVAGVARESISTAASLPKSRPKAASSSRSQSLLSPSKAPPIAASTTKLNATSDPSEAQPNTSRSRDSGQNVQLEAAPTGDEKPDKSIDATSDADRPLPASGWKGWWSKPTATEEGLPQPVSNELGRSSAIVDHSSGVESDPQASLDSPGSTTDATKRTSSDSRSSWFGLWKPGTEVENEASPKSCKAASLQPAQSNVEAASDTAPLPQLPAALATTHGRTPSGSWAFWSREKSPSADEGQLAIADTPSQDNPKPSRLTPTAPGQQAASDNPRKRKALEQPQLPKAGPHLAMSSENKTLAAPVPEKRASPEGNMAIAGESKAGEKAARAQPPNLVLPQFRATYRLAQTPSYWQQLVRMFGRNSPDEQRHLSIATTPHKFRTAVAIGVHGYFPSPIVQKVLGQPTGTSVRFANHAAEAIEHWAQAHGHSCEVEKVALEGEGTIAYRVDILWKLLLNWVDKLRQADFILVACHSQGVPVGIMLVAKLIEFGCLDPHARIGVCAMAGVNLGPFVSYKSRFLDSSASELFDFCNPVSQVSTAYSAAVETVLAHHVRIAYIGSIDDQLVSMESSTHSSVNHPYIYRAVFVNGKIHAPDFLTHLVGFALKLRNLGLSDHGLIRELSLPLAGSLYTGDGHSRIYEDPRVYDLAVEYALESTSLGRAMSVQQKYHEVPSAKPNPFYLPWAMRGLLEEEFVKTELKKETEELLQLFESWKPQSAVLKDVKFRLEAVKSKL